MSTDVALTMPQAKNKQASMLLIHVDQHGMIKHDGDIACASLHDGIKITLTKTPKAPLLLHFDGAVVPFFLEAMPDVSFELLQVFSGTANNQEASSTITLNANARGFFYQIAELNHEGSVEHRCTVALDKKASLDHYCINLSEGSFKQTIDCRLHGDDAAVNFYLLDQLFDYATGETLLTITHDAQHSKSTQLVRAIYGDSASGTFLGKVVVEKTSPHASAKQHYRTLLLSEQAKASVLPQLEINNNDITASHGATIGELDPEALFYLRSRGLTVQEAKKLLVMALSAPIIDTIKNSPIASMIKQKTNHALIKSLGA